MGPGKNVVIRTLAPGRWAEAGALAGRAFWTEDYMAVLAEDPLERFAVVQDLYLRMQLSDSTTTLAAFAGDHVVGIACVERGGSRRRPTMSNPQGSVTVPIATKPRPS